MWLFNPILFMIVNGICPIITASIMWLFNLYCLTRLCVWLWRDGLLVNNYIHNNRIQECDFFNPIVWFFNPIVCVWFCGREICQLCAELAHVGGPHRDVGLDQGPSAVHHEDPGTARQPFPPLSTFVNLCQTFLGWCRYTGKLHL